MNVMSQTEIAILRLIADEVDKVLRSPNKPSLAILGGLTKVMERNLPKLTLGRNIKVEWDDTKPMEPYIMAMYPDPEELNKKSTELFGMLVDADGIVSTKTKASNEVYHKYVEKWCEIQNWQLFIDIRLVDTGSALSVTTGDQFAAVLAHEIGHVMNGDPIELIKTYRENLYQQSKLERMLLSKNFFVRKVALPLFVNTLQFRIVTSKPDAVAEEMAADSYVPEEFRGALVSYITDRLLKTTAGTRLIITKEEYKAQHKTGFRYHRSTIELLIKRRDVLKRRMDAQYNHPSMNPYLKNLMRFCSKGVIGFKPDNKEEDALEEARLAVLAEKEYDRVMEMASLVLEGAKGPSERDITMLELEIGDITNADDRLWCIQTIYDYIEDIERIQKKNRESAAKKGVVLPDTKDPRLARLWELRNKVMAMNVEDNRPKYGVVIQYPKGYEG